jgi:hypothetical protein
MGRHARTAPVALSAALVGMVIVLMGLNAIGAYGFLTRVHLDHAVVSELATSDRAADVSARLDVQGHVVANLDKQLGQIDAAIDEATRRGRSSGAMRLAEEQRRARAHLAASRQREARTLAELQVRQARVDAERKRAADVGPVRYLAQLIAGPNADLEHAVRLLTLAVVLVLDPMAVLLLIAATRAAPTS